MPDGPALFVAGGIGQTPFLALARDWLAAGGGSGVSATLLYGVRPLDAPTLVGVAALLLVVSGTACAVPARRAIALNPIEALRA